MSHIQPKLPKTVAQNKIISNNSFSKGSSKKSKKDTKVLKFYNRELLNKKEKIINKILRKYIIKDCCQFFNQFYQWMKTLIKFNKLKCNNILR